MRGLLLDTDFIENGAQLVEVYRFDQMKIESCLFTAPDIFVCAKSSNRYSFDRLFAFCLSNYLVAAAVRKTDIAQDDIEFVRLKYLQGTLGAVGDKNLMTEVTEQA